jgi:hypothetical protein
MADIVRTKAGVAAIFPDGTSGDISAQDLRDFVVSVLGVYAGLYVTGGTTSDTVGISYSTVNWVDGGNAEEDTCDGDYANDRIEVGGMCDGVYKVTGSFCISGTASTTFTVQAAVNGTNDDSLSGIITLDASGNVAHVGFSGNVTLADGDYVTVRVVADGMGKTFLLEEGQLHIHRIG